jgi:hypothetical protein
LLAYSSELTISYPKGIIIRTKWPGKIRRESEDGRILIRRRRRKGMKTNGRRIRDGRMKCLLLRNPPSQISTSL